MNSKLPERPKNRNYGLRAGQSSVVRVASTRLPTAAESALTLAEKPAGAVQPCKRLMKGAFRDQLEQAVKFENQVFAERVRFDEAKEAFRAFFEKRKPASNDTFRCNVVAEILSGGLKDSDCRNSDCQLRRLA